MRRTATKLFKLYETLKEQEECKEVEQEFITLDTATLSKTVERLKVLIRIGTLGTKREWDKLFKYLGNLMVNDKNFTMYEAHHTSLFINLYYALCMLPIEYKQKIISKNHKDFIFNKDLIRNFAVMYREDIAHMAMRHKSFVECFNNTSLHNRMKV